MDLVCGECGKGFEKRNAEYNRQIKKNPNVNFFCSRSCSTTYGNKVTPRGTVEHLKNKGYEKKLDEYSPFRFFLRKARSRNKGYDIDLPYLKLLWEEQNGCCTLSGVKMKLPLSSVLWEGDIHNPWKPSLDRIDSSKGYMKGNVRFVCVIANLAKHSWTDEEFIEFVKKSAEFWENK